ncbi:MAG: DUF4292 domain-containing protein [Bacteroidaceae bacterium]|nr:DUF4292 domain-containing protein [Bacteroidaceae bacterium]
MKRIALIIALTLLVLVTGCRSRRAVLTSPDKDVPAIVTPTDSLQQSATETPSTSSESPKDDDVTTDRQSTDEVEKLQTEIMFDNMLSVQAPWNTIVTKGRVSLGSLSSSFEMRMINNESISVSLRPIFGIEIARVVMTRDSVFLYDKINKRYIAEGITSFSDNIPFEPTISDLQNTLLGRPFLLGHTSLVEDDYDRFIFETAGSDWAMQPRELPDGVVYMFAMNESRLICAVAQQLMSHRQLHCEYQYNDSFAECKLPHTLILTAQGKSKSYSINIQYSSVKWDTPISVEKLSTNGMKKTTLSTVVESLLK